MFFFEKKNQKTFSHFAYAKRLDSPGRVEALMQANE